MQHWYKVVTLRKEVREGRSFDPDEFAIALEQVVAGTAPDDYVKPRQFFARTCFTGALTELCAMVLRRLAGESESAPPVTALLTQFGGGKTHTLTALYHMIRDPREAARIDDLKPVLRAASLKTFPDARVAVFVGNAWDPTAQDPTPWISIARQLAGAEGVAALGPEAREKAPGTLSLQKVYERAGGRVLVLCDEVLNYLSRHRDRAEAFKDFFANLVRSMTGATGRAALVSLPASKPEMSEWELTWQGIISKEAGRIASQHIVNDEAEISEVVRRRLVEDLGGERVRRNVAQAFATWCYERRAQLPSEWTAVDTVSSGKKGRERLEDLFDACYPFHPATLSVFRRKWQALAHYQQTRGTLAMFAQWLSQAARESFIAARMEPLITLGSAPLHNSAFRSLVLSQLNEPRLGPAIEADIAGEYSKARALDADTTGPLRDIHRRVATAVFFECSGGQIDKVAHLPELRFALGEPEIDTPSIDNAVAAIESRAFFLRRVGTDGYRIGRQPTLKKVVSDRRASLDADKDVTPAVEQVVKAEFERCTDPRPLVFPGASEDIQDSPKLSVIVADPEWEWDEKSGSVRAMIAEWTKRRGQSIRRYPASLIWCIRRPGRDLRIKVEENLAWRRVQEDIGKGTLGSEFDPGEVAEVRSKVAEATDAAREEVWGSYRYVAFSDNSEPDGLKVLDLGAGHASSGETLVGRVLVALKTSSLLNDTVAVSYLDRNWPPALKTSGSWPLSGLRQAFLDGSLTRLRDPEVTLRSKILESVAKGDFGLGSCLQPDQTFERLWFGEPVSPDDVAFTADVFLLTRKRAQELRAGRVTEHPDPTKTHTVPLTAPVKGDETPPPNAPTTSVLHLSGAVPPELWNRLGTRLLPKLRSGQGLEARVDFRVTAPADRFKSLLADVEQALADLGLAKDVRIDQE